MKRAQLSLFIIIGILLLAIGGVLLFVNSSMVEDDVDDSTTKILDELSHTQSIEYYVTSCLNKVARDGIYLIGLQGGFLFKEQNGLIDWDIPYIEYNLTENVTANVSYQIYRPDDYWVSDPPYYPCYRRGGNNLWKGENCHKKFNYSQMQYQLGKIGEPTNSVLPELCSKKKAQYPGYICDCVKCDGYSLKEQLTEYITNEVMECIKFESYSVGKGYTVSKGQAVVNVTIGRRQVFVSADIPIRIQYQYSDDIFKTESFAINIPVRLKDIYDTVNHIRLNDIYNLTFDMVKDGYAFANKVDLVNITIERILVPNGDTIIVITDMLTYVNSKRFKYAFAVENRNPALDFFRFDAYGNPKPDTVEYFIVENETMYLRPFAVDPDENVLEYEYSGWPIGYSWESSDSFLTGGNGLCLNPITKGIDVRRCADYYTVRSDLGHQTVRITARDPGGMTDFQDIHVFVDDRPEIILEFDNYYSDIINFRASTEDPFLFDGSQTTVIFDHGPIEFKLTDNDEPLFIADARYSDWGSEPKRYMPLTFNPVDPGISWPPTIGYFQNPIDGAGYAVHEVTLEARKRDYPQSFAYLTKPIEVHECLPHRNPIEIPPFPFNTFKSDEFPLDETNPFQADHSCCGLGPTNNPPNPPTDDGYFYGELKKSGATCYEQKIYGCYSHITDTNLNYDTVMDNWVLPKPIPTDNTGGPFTAASIAGPIDDDQHHIVYLDIEVMCSDSRGNMCDITVPPATYTAEYHATCPDCTHCAWGKDTCQTDDWYTPCDAEWKCSPSDTLTGGYGDGGRYCCQGGCDIASTPVCWRGLNCREMIDDTDCLNNCHPLNGPP